MKKVLGCIRRADEQFGLIADGDRIAVGVSGGKDSLLLFYALTLYKRFCKKEFDIVGITLDLGFRPFDAEPVARFAEKIGATYHIYQTDIKEVVFDIRQEKNPCALCAKLRRGALHGHARAAGCNKVALGHHREDVLETPLLSLFFEGRLHTFVPSTYLGRSDVTVIRPMVFLPEADVIGAARRLGLPVVHNCCPANGYTKRQDMKELLKYLSHNVVRDAPLKMIGALARTDQYLLWDKPRIKEIGGEGEHPMDF